VQAGQSYLVSVVLPDDGAATVLDLATVADGAGNCFQTAQSVPVAPGGRQTAADDIAFAGDGGFYRLDVPQGPALPVLLTLTPDGGWAADLRLYDGDGKLVARAAGTAGVVRTVLRANLGAGKTYCVRVAAGDDSLAPGSAYGLTLA